MTQRQVEDRKPINSMKLSLKKLENQVVVLTGATSGIGLVTARMIAKKGAKLVLAARNEEALHDLAEELRTKGTNVVYLKTDVAKEEDVNKLAQKAIDAFGGFDTWINNASVSLYGHMIDTPIEDTRDLFEVNYWGTVYGSLAAVRHFKERGTPGALINMGSILGNQTFPIQGSYSSSKHAVQSFTDALRMEAEKDHLPVVVSQIHPARVNTPYTEHAASYIDKTPSHDGMMYPPESVAEAVLHMAEHPTRDIYVGGQAKMVSVMGALMPRFTDRYLERSVYKTNYDDSRQAEDPEESSLHGNAEEMKERGKNSGWTRKGSWMVKAKKHPLLVLFSVVGIVFFILALCLKPKHKKMMVDKPKKAIKAKKRKAMIKHPKETFMLKHPKKAFMLKHPRTSHKISKKMP